MPISQTIAAFRFGYGLPMDTDLTTQWRNLAGPDLAAQRWQGITQDQVIAAVQAVQDARQKEADAPAAEAKKLAGRTRKRKRDVFALAYQGFGTSFARAMGGDGLRERLVRFWADHFSVAPKNQLQRPWPAVMVDDAIRPNIAGLFSQMLFDVATHPAMLLYLDQYRSVGPGSKRGQNKGLGLNENYARELLELHTLGVNADYNQTDIRELAELLTGLAFNEDQGFVFDGNRVEPGPETVLGKTYRGKKLEPIAALLTDLSVHPATAQHMATKLAVHFVADDPDPSLVAALRETWLNSGGDLHQVTHTLITHPASAAPQAQKVRQPFEFLVASARALRADPDRIYQLDRQGLEQTFLTAMTAMGEAWLDLPGPNGRPEDGRAWISPPGMAARLEWALNAADTLQITQPDPRQFVQTALAERASDKLIWAVSAAQSQDEGLALVLSSPEFNRR